MYVYGGGNPKTCQLFWMKCNKPVFGFCCLFDDMMLAGNPYLFVSLSTDISGFSHDIERCHHTRLEDNAASQSSSCGIGNRWFFDETKSIYFMNTKSKPNHPKPDTLWEGGPNKVTSTMYVLYIPINIYVDPKL
jgi:hypothetical protein